MKFWSPYVFALQINLRIWEILKTQHFSLSQIVKINRAEFLAYFYDPFRIYSHFLIFFLPNDWSISILWFFLALVLKNYELQFFTFSELGSTKKLEMKFWILSQNIVRPPGDTFSRLYNPSFVDNISDTILWSTFIRPFRIFTMNKPYRRTIFFN